MEKDLRLLFKQNDEAKFLKLLRKVIKKTDSRKDIFNKTIVVDVLNFYIENNYVEFKYESIILLYNVLLRYSGFFDVPFVSKIEQLAKEANYYIENSPSDKPIKIWF